eukprot:761183-Hanusia_phi.AAC.1
MEARQQSSALSAGSAHAEAERIRARRGGGGAASKGEGAPGEGQAEAQGTHGQHQTNQVSGLERRMLDSERFASFRAALDNYERCVDKNEISKLEAVQNVLKASGQENGFMDSQGGPDSQTDLQVEMAEQEARRILKTMVEEGYRKKSSIWHDVTLLNQSFPSPAD